MPVGLVGDSLSQVAARPSEVFLPAVRLYSLVIAKPGKLTSISAWPPLRAVGGDSLPELSLESQNFT